MDNQESANAYFREIDIKTYNELQKLIRFVNLVADMNECSAKDKTKAKEIIDIIKNINIPEKIKHFNVCFDLKNYAYDSYKVGDKIINFRKWDVWFEFGFFQIEAATYYINDINPIEEHFYYNSYVSFRKDDDISEKVCITSDIDEFVADAMNYKNYITDTLKKIDIDIDI